MSQLPCACAHFRTEISDDELSDVSEKKGKLEQKESLQVESEKDEEDEEDEDDDDEEPGEDEYWSLCYITGHLLISYVADSLLKLLRAISSMRT